MLATLAIVDDAAPPPPVSGDESAVDLAEIADSALREALEFAVGVAAASAKRRPPIPFPAALKPFFKMTRLDRGSLRAVRRVLVAESRYRSQLGSVAEQAELGALSIAWLRHGAGWEDAARQAVERAKHEGAEADLRSQLAAAQRRREAAEGATARALAQTLADADDLARLRRELVEQRLEAATLRQELDAQRRSVASLGRDAQRHLAALSLAHGERDRLAEELGDVHARLAVVEQARDRLLEEYAGQGSVPVGTGQTSVSRAKLGPTPRRATPHTHRKPIAIPGGLYGDADEVANLFLRTTGAEIVVDGYNVAKGAWPKLELSEQRDRCVTAGENIARRFGCRITVIFDGADVVGAVAVKRRLVRVSYSPGGVTADDSIRAMIAAIPSGTPIVVVTEDQAILASVRSLGGNTMTCGQWLRAAY